MTYADIIWKLVEKLLDEKQQEERIANNQSSQAKD